MDQQLTYCIAQEYIRLITPSAEATRAILPNYEPFHVDALPEGASLLFTFTGGVDLSALPRKALLEDKLFDGVRASIYHTSESRLLLELSTQERTHTMVIDRDWQEVQSDVLMDDPSDFFFINRLVMIVYGVAIAPHHMLKVHASVTELEGNALLFLGTSGTGKSTHSRLWRKFVSSMTTSRSCVSWRMAKCVSSDAHGAEVLPATVMPPLTSLRLSTSDRAQRIS